MNKFIDLTGKRFGILFVIKKVEKPNPNMKDKHAYWLCKCDCGKEKIICSPSLRSPVRGKKSCGCLGNGLPYGEASLTRLFGNYKRHAKERNLLFELSREEFSRLTKGNCFYCNKHPSYKELSKNINGEYIYNGIDRINPKTGYTTENTVSCCKTCNEGKWSQTQEDFFEWIEIVHNNLSNKGLI